MKILLVCSTGMSTSMLVKRMEKYANSNNIDVKIEAASDSIFDKLIANYDVALLAPQIRYNKERLELIAKEKGVRVGVIDTVDYGTMNEEKVLKLAFDIVSANKNKDKEDF